MGIHIATSTGETVGNMVYRGDTGETVGNRGMRGVVHLFGFCVVHVYVCVCIMSMLYN